MGLPDAYCSPFLMRFLPAAGSFANGRPGRLRSSWPTRPVVTATSEPSRAIRPNRTTSLRFTRYPARASRRRTRSIRSASAAGIEKVLTVLFLGAFTTKLPLSIFKFNNIYTIFPKYPCGSSFRALGERDAAMRALTLEPMLTPMVSNEE